MKLENKVAVLMGGEGPLGRAVTKKFLEEGAKIAVAWYSPEEWQEASGLIPANYKDRVFNAKVDATKEDQVKSFIENSKKTFGSVDILLHMVGMFHAGQLLWDMDAVLMQRLVDTNFMSAFLGCKYAVKAMMEKGRGRIVLFPPRETIECHPRFGAYGVSKAGLNVLISALREELKETGITVNGVMPSVMDTWRTRHMPNAQPEKWVKPSEVAELLSVLCSDESAAVSGSILKVFGKL